MKERFVERNFSSVNLVLIETLNEILGEYESQGYRLTLRQLYYQLVARGMIANTVKSYNHIGSVVSNARLAGLIDWSMIEDRTRETVTPPMWESPAHIVEAAAQQFAIDRWKDQPKYIEVMVEKSALEGILIPVCKQYGVRFTANRGYSSSSTMYEIAKRVERMMCDCNKDVVILYLGDHDPSGIDMTRDVMDRIGQMAHADAEVKRLALNMDQVEMWNPPENPAKTTDSRFHAYQLQFGESSWELDSVEPKQLARLISEAIESNMDHDRYEKAIDRENGMKKELMKFVKSYRNSIG